MPDGGATVCRHASERPQPQGDAKREQQLRDWTLTGVI
jgi:hypothetical protein